MNGLLKELIGESPGIEALREKIRRLLDRPPGSRQFPPILIQGETGTGKGLLARLIHRMGPRVDGPFVDVNCAAIPGTLLESELFGFERGAFTDARQGKPGLFQAAHRGTIFLDEVGELPEGLQAKLLKVIEERSVRRLGSTRSEPVDVSILTATNKDLAVETRARRFREDLYHRLAVLTLWVPPLRERGEDVLLLADHFLARTCAEYGLPAKTFAPGARAALRAYPWRGNIRELSNVIESVALLTDEPTVTAEMLEEKLELPDEPAPGRGVVAPDGPLEPLAEAVDSLERAHLLAALRETRWNISRAAARLGITRNTMRYRIEKHRLAPEESAPPPSRRAERPARPAPPAPSPTATPAPVSSVRWERRRVTLLRADAGSATTDSPLSASRVVQILVEKVQSFGGQIEELSPAGIVAVFGLEPAEDAPRRAAHAAMAMQKAAERARREGAEPFDVRVGIHVDQCLVGQATGGPRIDPDAKRVGAAMLGALLGATQIGTTSVSEAAASLLERRFDVTPLDTQGEGLPGRLYRLGHERRGLGPGRRMARFVGRDHDLQLLESRVAAAMAGRGQAVGIVGEAGMGKSRLVFELRQRLRGEAVTYLRGRCLSYGSAVPYLPVLDMLRQAFLIAEADRRERIGEKIREGLRELGMDPDESAPYLLELFAVKEGTERLAVLSDQAIRGRTLETFRRLVLEGSRQRPMVFVVEDLHWVDRASEACFTMLVEQLAGSPILFLATYRPGYRPPWIDKSFATQIALQPLSPQDSLALVRSVLPRSSLPERLARLILDKAEGNPFFLEEMSRAVGERGDLKPALTIPDTIQEVLLARIDRLGEKPKRLLQAASLLRREFSRRLLGAIWEGPLEPHLEELTRLEFLFEQSRTGEPTYVFKHALIQEVAYESLPASDRRALHAAAARALEATYAGRLEEAYDSLAYHYSKTDESAKAVEYLTRSAERAARGYAHEEAVRALREAVAHVGRLPEAERDARLLDLLLRQASSLTPLGRVQEILDLLVPQQDRLARLGDRALSGRYYFLVGRTYSFLGQYARAAENAERAIAEARECGDEATMGKAYSLLAIQAALSGQAHQGIELGRQAIARLERTEERWWLGQAYWVVGLNYSQMGEFEPALDAEGRAHAIGEDLGDPRLMAFASWVSGLIYASLGEWEAGIEACQRALRLAPDPLERAIAAGCLGYAYLEKGDTAAAIPLLERSVQQLCEFHYRPFQGWFSVFLAEACRRERRLERATDLAMQGLVITRDANFRTGVGWAQQILGRIAEARGDHAASEAHLTEARETFTAIRSRYELARTFLDLVGVARARGNRDALATNLRAAYRLFRTLRVERYVQLTARLARQTGVGLSEEPTA